MGIVMVMTSKKKVSLFFIYIFSSFKIIYKHISSSIWKEALENYKINV